MIAVNFKKNYLRVRKPVKNMLKLKADEKLTKRVKSLPAE